MFNEKFLLHLPFGLRIFPEYIQQIIELDRNVFGIPTILTFVEVELAPHEKLGVDFFTKAGPITDIDLMITDEEANIDTIEEIESKVSLS